MKAVVHIGMPKAGSTTIQEFLHLNAKALEAQGFLYRRFHPRDVLQGEYVTLAYHTQGKLFDDKLRQKRYHTRSLDDLAREAGAFEAWFEKQTSGSSAETWLVSSEMLTAAIRNKAGTQAVHDWFAAHFDAVDYVVYLRRQDLWLASSYSQQLRAGSTKTFEDFIRRTRGRNYHKLVRNWAEIAGHPNIKIRLLDPDGLVGGDLIADYCAATGIDPAGLQRPGRLNESFTRRGASLIRRVNVVTGKLMPAHSVVSRAIRKGARVFAQAVFRGEKFQLMPKQRNRILAAAAESNEALRQEFFPDRATLFSAPAPAPRARAKKKRHTPRRTPKTT